MAAWKRPGEIFVPAHKEGKGDKNEKEGKGEAHSPPFCIVSPYIPPSASGQRSTSPNPGLRSSLSRGPLSHQDTHLRPDPSPTKLPDIPGVFFFFF